MGQKRNHDLMSSAQALSLGILALDFMISVNRAELGGEIDNGWESELIQARASLRRLIGPKPPPGRYFLSVKMPEQGRRGRPPGKR